MGSRSLSGVAWGLAAALAWGVALATTYTVDDDGPADFASIQSAINAATTGDQIVVKPGRYHETLSFLGKSITVRSEKGPAATVVYLEGQTRIVQLDGDATLQGFTITGGRQRVGGGILVTGGANPIIEDNVIEGNTAAYNDATGFPGLGGGIAIEAPCEPVITRNVIRGNQALASAAGLYGYGAAIAVDDGATAVITSNVIVGNASGQIGGAIYVGVAGTTSPVVITNNTISGNQAGGSSPDTSSYGGGISLYDGAVATVQNNAIDANSAAYSGGGIYFFASNTTGLDYKNNDFDGNLPDNCAGLPSSKCNGSQLFLAPLYQDAAGGNYRLRSDSPLVDKGVTGSQGTLDADGRARNRDGDLNGTALPDVGAFENQGELTRLTFDSATALHWDGSANASMVFDAYRSALSTLAPGPIGACWHAGLTSPSTTDAQALAPGEGFFYLVGGRATVRGSLGFDGQGAERTPQTACP